MDPTRASTGHLEIDLKDLVEDLTIGQHYSPEALDLVTEASGMYPYFVQEFWSAMWKSALKSPFTQEDAEAAITLGREKLDTGFFVARWQRATKAERRFLHAMAQDGEGPSGTGDIAARMGKKPTTLGPARATLIDKGLIYSPEYGHVAFTVPGMTSFIAHQELPD